VRVALLRAVRAHVAAFATVLAAAFATALAFVAPAPAAEPKVLNVYNWTDYVTEDALAAFTAATGIRVNYDVYDSNDVLEAKLLAGRSGYDLVFPSATPFFARHVAAGLYRPLDRARIPNLAGIDPAVMARLGAVDPGNAHGIPYMMAGTGLGYDIERVRALVPDAPLDSLALLFDPKIAARLAGCGIAVLDTAEEVLPAALAYLGRDPTSTSVVDLDLAAEVVRTIRPHLRYFHSSRYINDLASGAICLAFGYAGDLVQARTRAREAAASRRIGIALPREGAAFNIDVMAIPRDAPHPENAHRFIDHLLEPATIAAVTRKIGYANAVPAARALVPADIRDDPVIYPPPGAKLYTIPLAPVAFERARTRVWSRLKTAR